MKRNYSIHEISELLQIPKSTLRYWDDVGLISLSRNKENDYREFSLQSALDISDIAFYRSLDISIEELKNLSKISTNEMEQMLKKTYDSIENEIRDLKRKKERVKRQCDQIKEMYRLKTSPYQVSIPDMQSVVIYNAECKAHWQKTINKPYSFALVLKDFHGNIIYGLAEQNLIQEEALLWQKQEKEYRECLLRVDVNKPQNNNAMEHIQILQQKGLQPSGIVARYLGSGFDEIRWDYYKAWIELE